MRDFKEAEPVNLTDGLIKGSMSTQKSIEEILEIKWPVKNATPIKATRIIVKVVIDR